MREEYQVTLQSQMGPREGQLTLQYKGSFVTGTLKLVSGRCGRRYGQRRPAAGQYLYQ